MSLGNYFLCFPDAVKLADKSHISLYTTFFLIFECQYSSLQFQDEGWKLNRLHYYQEGWLSTANVRGVVGVTYTTSHCSPPGHASPDGVEAPQRTNYNLRGHRSEVRRFADCFIRVGRHV